jgi:hypothetical protein
MVLEAGYPGTTGFRKVVKVKKKAGMSDADFVEHYNKTHAQTADRVLLKHNIITYKREGRSPFLPDGARAADEKGRGRAVVPPSARSDDDAGYPQR